MAEPKSYRMLIDGALVEAADGARLDSINPATGEVWATFPAATAGDVDRAVRAAHRAMTAGPWARLTATQRGKHVRRLGDLVAEHADRMAEVETIDTGKLLRETRGQIKYVAEFYHYNAGLADKIEGATLPIDKPDMLVMTVREPIGVVAAIVPWNSQLFLTALKLGPALAAGNAVVVKASEHGPASLLEFAQLIEQAGIPPGVVSVITGLGDPCGKALTSHPLVARVAFTGGPETARHVVRNAADNFAHVTLELGGKSPIVAFADADLDNTANGVIAGIFGASGQSCVAGSRLIVEDRLCESLLKRVVERAKTIKIGDPLDAATEMGPLCTRGQLDRIQEVVAKTVAAGGRLVLGGERPAHMNRGWYYGPTVIECPSAELPAVEQELFGPVLSVLRFKDEDEAVRLANDTNYGLAAGIFTNDGAKGLRVMKRLRSGVVWINTYRAVSPIVPFGGYGRSGYGREGGVEAVLDYTRTKSVWINLSSQPMADPFVLR
ncbi:MAG TPA: aldehyde dehydrogenase [Candidatus Acidoferrum sp.]|nr:aldehyde dehydrogenase [Candidatus Acidoferrum sp.]